MSRADRVAARLAERELDVLLVTDLVNLRYLTGFTGTNGLAIVGPDTRRFVTDFRYVERAKARGARTSTSSAAERELRATLDAGLARRRAARSASRTSTCPCAATPSCARRCPTGSSSSPPAASWRPSARSRSRARSPRSARPPQLVDEHLRLAARAAGSSGARSARSRSRSSRRCGSRGAEGPSFPSIVAAAENGALPHADAARRRDPDRHARHARHRRAARRLLLGLHAHLGDGRAPATTSPRSTTTVLRAQRDGAGRRPARVRRGARSTRSRAT